MAYQSNFKGDEVVALLNMVKNGGAGAVVRNLFTGDTLLDEEKAYNAETYQMVMEAEIPPIIMLDGALPMFVSKDTTNTSIHIYYHVHIASEHGIFLCKLGSDGTVTQETLAYDYCILYDNGDTKNTGVFNALRGAALFGNIIIEDAELGILRPVQIIPVDEDSVILVATDYSSGLFVNLVAYMVTSDDIVSRHVAQGPAAGGGEVLYLHKDEGAYTEQEQAANGAVLEAIKQGTLGGAAVVNYDGEYYTVVTAYTMTISGEDEYFIVATDYGKGKLLFIGKAGVEEFSLAPQTVIYINEGQTEQQKKENFINLMGAEFMQHQAYPSVYFRDGDKYYTSLGSSGLDWFFWDFQTASVGVVTINVDSDAGTLETTVERIPLNVVFGSPSVQVVIVPIGRELTDSEKQSNVEAYEAITNGMSLVFADCGAAFCSAKAYLDGEMSNFVIDVPTDSGVTTYKVVLASDGTVTTTELGSGSGAGTTDTTAVVEFVTSGELTAEQKATNAAVYSRIANGEKVVTFFKRNGEAYLMPMLHTDYDGHDVFFDLLQVFSSEFGDAVLGVAHIVMSSDGTVTASESTFPLGGNSVEAAILEFNSDGSALTAEQKAHNAEIYQKIFNNEAVQVYLNVGALVPLQYSSISGTEIILSASAIITSEPSSLRYQSIKLSSDGDVQMYEQKDYPLTGGGGSGSELREIYVADALDESQKAYNAETYNKIREGAGVLPYIKGANGAPRYLKNFTVWNAATPYITMMDYILDGLTSGTYTYLVVTLYSDGSASSASTDAVIPSLAVDSTLSITSENPVQNKVVKTKFNEVDSWLTRLQTKVNDWVESQEEIVGYFTNGKANDADKLDGYDSSHFATSEAVTQLSQKVDAIPTITVDTEMSDTSENAVQSKVIKAYVDDMKVKEVSQSAITQIELVPNTLYRLSDITSLVVTLAQGEVGVANYYMFEIAVGDAIPEITLPSSIRWMDGYDVLANLNKDTTYQISILNNLAVGGAFV